MPYDQAYWSVSSMLYAHMYTHHDIGIYRIDLIKHQRNYGAEILNNEKSRLGWSGCRLGNWELSIKLLNGDRQALR